MNNLITPIIIIFLVIAVFVYLERESKRRDRVEKERFREFVLAAKSKDLEEYVQVMPDDAPLPQEEEDELVDLDQVDPEMLLKAIKKNENN